MKQAFTIMFSLLLLNNCFAAIRTVSNTIGLPAQYSSLAAAITAATAGDTLYVYGTDIDYGDVSISKKLTIIGSGPYPYSKLNTQRTYINSVTLNSGSDGSILRGFEGYYIQTDAGVDNITVKNVALNYYLRIYGNNWLVENSTFNYNNGRAIYFEYNASSNITIQNCYISGHISRNGKAVTGLTVRNCNFIGVGDSFADNISGDFSNNIFCKNALSGSYGIYKNNITVNGAAAISNNFPNSNNVSSNAVASAVFIQYAYDEPFSISRNYHLAPGSPAIGIGFGGTDAGVYGGASPITSTQNEFYPNLPVIQYMILNSSSVQQGGTLDVKIKTFKQN